MYILGSCLRCCRVVETLGVSVTVSVYTVLSQQNEENIGLIILRSIFSREQHNLFNSCWHSGKNSDG